jgi:PEP-CTERM motif-containing protein
MKAAVLGMMALGMMAASPAAHSSLIPVTVDGERMISDSALNLTWADVASPANLSWSEFPEFFPTAQSWVASLNAEHYGGFDDWTLPTGDGFYTDGSGNCPFHVPQNGCGKSTSKTFNQLGYLFINELGNTPGKQIVNTGPFQTLSTNVEYWAGTDYGQNLGWAFFTSYGTEGLGVGLYNFEGMAVRPGQVASTPEPATLSLLGLAIAGLTLLRRRHSG